MAPPGMVMVNGIYQNACTAKLPESEAKKLKEPSEPWEEGRSPFHWATKFGIEDLSDFHYGSNT